MSRKCQARYPRSGEIGLWIVFGVASLFWFNLPAVQAGASTSTPIPTCSECELVATRAAGVGTAWALQSNKSTVNSGAQPVVQALLFWMDSCGHCHFVMEEVLPKLEEKYGERLEILYIEIKSVEDIDRLYLTGESLGISRENVAVPFLIIGEHVLIGSKQVPEQLPGLIEDFLSGGGVGLPDLAAWRDVLPATNSPEDSMCLPETPCSGENEQDFAAGTPEPLPITDGETSPGRLSGAEGLSNGLRLAIVVITGMLAALGYTGFVILRRRNQQDGEAER